MANTEGLTDEVVSSMLALPSAEEEEQQKRPLRTQQNPGDGAGHTQQHRGPSFPRRAFARREQLMELGEGEMPSATVIRSSNAPQIRSSSSRKRNNGKIISPPQPPAESIEEEEKIPDHNETQSSPGGNKIMHRPVILSDSIRERPAVDPSTSIDEPAPSGSGPKKRVSRFKQRNLNKNGSGGPTAGGFPSLDIAPVGAFTRKGRSPRVQDSAKPQMIVNRPQTSVPTSNKNSSTKLPNAGDDIGRSTASMLSNMSLDEIRDGVEEVTSILSAESIAFLRKRGQQKASKPKQAAKGASGINNQRIAANRPATESPIAQLTKIEEIQQEQNKEREGKEKMAELLSSVRTPEDMDRVYKEALQLGLAAELPSSSLEIVKAATGGEGDTDERVKNLHIASSLLRSTAPRQRLLGARSLCEILEQDVREFNEKRESHSYSDSHDDRESMKKTYPKLLPVAIRCLLDESVATFQTAGGRMLLSIVLRCIHALMTLCVHPYHVVNINPASGAPDDPFILYQTSFVSDVSHIPPGTELYPPTQIKPLDGGDATNASCYRADSSAASAESDSKSFYNDPAWVMLSRMRILPCISDIICCLSTDYATGNAISEATIQSICGILALLAVRSPGAAGAIARHKGILPFLMSYCLSPSNGAPSNGVSENKDDVGESLFNTGAALPALILLCTLARQSRDIAELEMPFQEVIPDLQAILCVEAESCEEEALQMWSIILLRILIKYGVAIEHIQLLINIAAPRVELMKPGTKLGAHYLQLFANICDASKMMRQKSNGQNLPTISEADCLAMAGVWLSSSVRSCAESVQAVLQASDNNHMKLASAQLRLLASYISTATPTMEASSIPIISKESCLEVIGTVLESNMFDSALNIALGASFHTNWDSFKNSNAQALEEEAIACSFVCSFMDFVRVLGQEHLGMSMRTSLLMKIIASMKRSSKRANISLSQSDLLGSGIHPGRKSWFVESEFSLLTILCGEKGGHDSFRHLLPSFGYSLLGRLNIGHEAMAVHILRQDVLFQVTLDTDGLEMSGNSLQTLFLRELSEDDRKLQSNHSSNIYPVHGLLGFNMGSFNSLRCTADIAGPPNSAGRDKFLLPLGGIWMWNILSSTTTSQSDISPGASQDTELLPFVSQTLGLLLQIETVSKGSSYSSCISDGAKLYHLTNTCLFSDEILSNDFVNATIELLYKKISGFNRYTTTRLSLVKDFVKACFEHSRLSKEKKKEEEDEKDPNAKIFKDLIDPDVPSSSWYSKNELRSLDDFVDDLCNSYIEYGGQYTMCTNFIRLFLRHDFPAKVISTLLTKLHPIVNLLTIEDEERSALLFSLTESISGGLPSSDSSQRDPSSVLDSFAVSLKKRDKELGRQDYVYLLAVGTLSRNFASSSQRCECGLEAMKNRLSGVSNSVFYDIAQVSQQFLSSGIGTKDSLIMSVMDVCMNSERVLSEQDDAVKENWQWNSSNADNIWDRTVAALRNVTEGV